MKKSLFTFFFVSFFVSSIAQIVYVDIDDTTFISTSTTSIIYGIDIDQNGLDDLNMSMMADISAGMDSLTGVASFVNGSFSSMNGMVKEPSWGDAFLFSDNDSIGINISPGEWTDFASEVVVSIYVQGMNYGPQWAGGVTDGFLGFKFEVSGNLHYGWIRMDVPDNSIEMTIKDWAYNSVPDEMILAGDTGTAIIDTSFIEEYNLSEEAWLYPTPTNGIIKLKNNFNGPIDISVYNLNGELIKKIIGERTKSFDMGDLKPGLFLVKVNTTDLSYIQKVLLQ